MSVVVPTNVIRRVEFRGQEIEALADESSRVWVSLRRLCENLSISGIRDQIEKVKEDETFEDLYKAILMQHPTGAKRTFCLDLEAVPFWLGSIQVNRIRDKQKRRMIVLYRRECMAVLREHFFGPQGNQAHPQNELLAELMNRASHLNEQQLRCLDLCSGHMEEGAYLDVRGEPHREAKEQGRTGQWQLDVRAWLLACVCV